tara:strand:- start:2545 stop:3054 length:510 start_codon:yes stop_codon:yes gene_type:complete
MRIISNCEEFRGNIIQKIKNIVIDDTKSINLEKGIYNYVIKEANNKKIVKKWDNPYFVQLYLDRLKSIYINLKNKDLLLRLQNDDISPQILANMTHQEMNEDIWKVLLEQKIKRDANKFTTNIEASTDMFTCRKCKSKRCTYYELQTRSADEPATIFVTCLECGKNWKS